MVDYFKVNTINSLPDRLYASGIDAVVVHSLNPTHLGYIVNAIEHGKHVLCEKPLVPVLDRFGKPSSKELDELEGIVQKKDPKVILMDAEHYSHKKPAIIFYENFWEIVGTSKIRRVEGEIKETDDPHFWRTKEILSGNNQTGILGDTMCHLLAFISNLGGRAIPQKRRYDLFEDDQVQYHTDTYDEVDFSIENVNGDYFTKDASASFVVCKFMDRFQQPQTKESKFIKFILNDNSEVVINFAEGSIKKVKDGQEKSYSFRYPLSGNEYVNILHCFYEGICNEVSPITGFGNSIRTLRSILSSYQLPNGDNARVKVYKTSE
jgi:predicted dehydrogenase